MECPRCKGQACSFEDQRRERGRVRERDYQLNCPSVGTYAGTSNFLKGQEPTISHRKVQLLQPVSDTASLGDGGGGWG